MSDTQKLIEKLSNVLAEYNYDLIDGDDYEKSWLLSAEDSGHADRREVILDVDQMKVVVTYTDDKGDTTSQYEYEIEEPSDIEAVRRKL